MTNKELQSFLKQYPDDAEVSAHLILGGHPVAIIDIAKVGYSEELNLISLFTQNYKKLCNDCIEDSSTVNAKNEF